MPTIAAFAHKKSIGQPFVYPDNSLDYESNFLRMMFAVPSEAYALDPDAARAPAHPVHPPRRPRAELLDRRPCGWPARAWPTCTPRSRRAIAALWGPLHGGANQEVLEMLGRSPAIGGDVAPAVDAGQGQERPVPAHGLRTPRLQELRPAGPDHQGGRRPSAREAGRRGTGSCDIALELESVALSDPYFVDRKLYPNVDFYSGLIYRALGFPVGHVHGPVRDRPPARLDRPMA